MRRLRWDHARGFESGLEGQCELLKEQVESREYWAWPLRRVVIEKHPGSKETRVLCVPAVRDRVLQTAVAFALEPVLEPEFEDCSFAYRRGRGVRMAVGGCAVWQPDWLRACRLGTSVWRNSRA